MQKPTGPSQLPRLPASQPSLGFPSGWGRGCGYLGAGATSSQMRACTNHHHRQGDENLRPPLQLPPPTSQPGPAVDGDSHRTQPVGSSEGRQQEKSGRHNLYLLARIQSPRNVRTLLRRMDNQPPGPDRPQASSRLNKKQGPGDRASADRARARADTGLTDVRSVVVGPLPGRGRQKDEILHGAPGMISRRIKIIGSEILRQQTSQT